MKYEIRRIEPKPFARMVGIGVLIPSLIGFLFWLLLYGFIGGFYSGFEYGYSSFGYMGLGILFGALVVVLLVYAAGLVGGLLFAVVYNWLVQRTKGIQLDIDLVKEETKKES